MVKERNHENFSKITRDRHDKRIKERTQNSERLNGDSLTCD